MYVRGEGVARKVEDRGVTKGKNSRSFSPGAIILEEGSGGLSMLDCRPSSVVLRKKSKGCMLDDGH